MAGCPLAMEVLPQGLHKHVDPRAPVALRTMGAKGLVPAVAPGDLATMLFFLSHDDEATVRDTAVRSAAGLPEKIWSVALRSEDVEPEVLDWMADRLGAAPGALQAILLNPSTSDETVARLAPVVPAPLLEIIRQNELRLLRHDDIVRGLCRNPAAPASTVDGACDFCVRNGLVLLDVPPMVDAYRRIHGSDPAARPAADSARALMDEYGVELAHDPVEGPEGSAPPPTPEQEQKRQTMTQRVLKMSVAEKIKLATLGNREARTLLLRDSNRLVSLAAAQSPRITDGEILGLANSRTASADVLRYIYESRDFLKVYALRAALVRNPKVPLPTALKFLPTLQEKDIKELSRDRNVPATVQAQAKAWMMKREQASRGNAGGKH
ncbi:MAG TPA: hypothetical protein VFM53_13160 [Anaeromyxobacteraceae bacterium]|nr:hypothetical protein [Anaeromyxobacteraceae bacterium]